MGVAQAQRYPVFLYHKKLVHVTCDRNTLLGTLKKLAGVDPAKSPDGFRWFRLLVTKNLRFVGIETLNNWRLNNLC